ncbi:MAG: hypothetical protein K6G78_00155 [bacterium]|nr:hypothetical protein [bacterium]
MSNQAKYDEKISRLYDAIALKEPDRVPINPILQCFPFYDAGHTMAEILYDEKAELATADMLRFAEEFDPDMVMGQDYVNVGMGPIYELADPKTIMWAGMPNARIDKNSIHQFLEFPVVEDDEVEDFTYNRAEWALSKGAPRSSGLLAPLAMIPARGLNPFVSFLQMAGTFSHPDFRNMVEKLWAIGDKLMVNGPAMAGLNAAIEEAGYPVMTRAMASVPFDTYSDFYRGTVDGLIDMGEYPKEVMAFCEEELQNQLMMIDMAAQAWPGKYVFMPLHKGMDGFMSDEDYVKFYWNHLQIIINHIIDVGMIPYIYTEGPYTTRLEHLAEVPTGKVVYHFENVDWVKAKKVLGGVACLAGGFHTPYLDRRTPEQIKDETKRILDLLAPGGGFIFETSHGIDYSPHENVMAMIETVKEYGKY